MTRAISALLKRADREYLADGIVATDTMMELASEGYDLDALENRLAKLA